jgi:hypothetical protein
MSKFGTRRNCPDYDKFKTGLTYQDVYCMMMDESEDREDWKYKRRGTVLGRWHQIKKEMFYEATGIEV